jgi:hypothetical protein
MEPVELPLLPSHDEGEAYLFIPGFDGENTQTVEFQVDWDRAVLNVFLYEGEDDEDQEMEGMRVPVLIDEERMPLVQEMHRLYVTDPRKLSPGMVGEEDYMLLKEEFEEWKERRD